MSVDGLIQVTSFIIPENVALETFAFLAEMGGKGFEGFVLWSGQLTDARTFKFQSCIIPDQTAMQTDSGLLVTVDGSALFEVNRLVHARKEILAAQVHSHPGEAYHSDTDDRYPLVTLIGSLSVVIPDFAQNAAASIDNWAWFRLSRHAEWLPADETTEVYFE